MKATLLAQNSLCERPRVINSLIHTHIPLFFIYNDIHVNFATFDSDDIKSSCSIFIVNFPFKISISNGNRTEWSPIRSVIIRVITKSVRFVYHEYDYRPNWTTRSPIAN